VALRTYIEAFAEGEVSATKEAISGENEV